MQVSNSICDFFLHSKHFYGLLMMMIMFDDDNDDGHHDHDDDPLRWCKFEGHTQSSRNHQLHFLQKHFGSRTDEKYVRVRFLRLRSWSVVIFLLKKTQLHFFFYLPQNSIWLSRCSQPRRSFDFFFHFIQSWNWHPFHFGVPNFKISLHLVFSLKVTDAVFSAILITTCHLATGSRKITFSESTCDCEFGKQNACNMQHLAKVNQENCM